MNHSEELLSSILKTVQMGQTGIRAVLNAVQDQALRTALEDQLREYDTIETEARSIARSRSRQPRELPRSALAMAGMFSRTRLRPGQSDSKIAAMMVQGNTRGMIKGLKNLHRLAQPDAAAQQLQHKLLAREEANIRQMHPFL